MTMLMLFFIILFMLVNILINIVNFISKKTFKDREKTSPFECGFDPKNSARLPFSLQFFLVAMIFLIFDVEITLILPFILTLNVTNIIMYSSLTFSFLIILLFGLYHEWKQGALNWNY